MPIWPGYFERGHPRLNVIIAGTQGSPEDVPAVVDTGFNGFMMMPDVIARSHALETLSTSAGTLADGSRVAFRTAIVRVGFARRSEQGAAMLTPSGPCLLGIDFLRKFGMALLMTRQQLWLMEEALFEKIAVASGAARKTAPVS